MTTTDSSVKHLTLVAGGTGKTGRRVAERLRALGVPTRIGSRSADLPFDWNDQATWAPALNGVSSVYIVYYPDLAVPGAAETIQAFVDLAVERGVRKLVLLSGRGEEEAQRCEEIVQNAGVDWTVLRATWFSQNFSEGFMRDLVLGGTVALPAGDVREPFVDVEDIADIAAAALTEPGHDGQVYELTGPRLLTFAEAVNEISAATGREVAYAPVSHEEFLTALEEQGVPDDYRGLLDYLFREVMDGRNSRLTDGVERALGRPPRDFQDFAREAAAAGSWGEKETAA
jgi:uncharacterized protein YbjT (DUF2867 family)